MKKTITDNQRNVSFGDFNLPDFDFTQGQNSSVVKARQEVLEFYQTGEYEDLWSSVSYAKFVGVISVIFLQLFLYLAREVSALPLDLSVRIVIYKACGVLSLIFLLVFAGACSFAIYRLLQMMISILQNGGYFSQENKQ